MVRGAGVWLAVALCATAVVVATLLGPVTLADGSALDRIRGGEPSGPATPGVVVDDAPTDVLEPGEPVLGVPAEVLASMVLVIVVSALLVRSLLAARREEPRPDDEDDDEADDLDPARPVDLPAVLDAARRGVRRLDDLAGGDPADAVVACWVELERAGGAAGSPHAVTDTPTDFARRLEAAAPGLDREALDRLRRVYSRVRYGGRGAGPEDVAAARACLDDLLATLEPVA